MAKKELSLLKTTLVNVDPGQISNRQDELGVPRIMSLLNIDNELVEYMKKAFLACSEEFGYAELVEGSTIMAALADSSGYYLCEFDGADINGSIKEAGDPQNYRVVVAAAMAAFYLHKQMQVMIPRLDELDGVLMADTLLQNSTLGRIQVETKRWSTKTTWSQISEGKISGRKSSNPKIGTTGVRFGKALFDLTSIGIDCPYLEENRKIVSFEEKAAGDDRVSLPPNYKPDEKTIRLAENIYDSYMFGAPSNNIGLYGDAGSGKSVMSAALAYLFGLPRYRFLFTTRTEAIDVYGTMMPKTDRSFASAGLPSFEDVEFDTEGAYEKLFGCKMPEGLAGAKQLCLQKLQTIMEEDKNNFVFVPSEIIKAMMYGGVVEFGEAEVVKDQGVMTCLNNLLEKGSDAFVVLPNGLKVTRHPLCVVVLTTNVGYAGCKPLNESVLSRMDEWIEVETPDITELVKRVRAQTSIGNVPMFEDTSTLREMAETLRKMGNYAAENDYTSGSTGVRELIAWAKKALVLEMREKCEKGIPQKTVSRQSVIKAAFSTVLTKTSQDKEDAEDIRHIFEQVYGLEEVKNLEAEGF